MKLAMCFHQAQLAACSFTGSNEIAEVLASIGEGQPLSSYGTCTNCGVVVERTYEVASTLPMLAAKIRSVAAQISVTEDTLPLKAGVFEGIPPHIYIVHTGEGLAGTCGLQGMAFAGINRRTKEFVYKCRCGFAWNICCHDLGQLIVQGLHRSPAARRAFLRKPDPDE